MDYVDSLSDNQLDALDAALSEMKSGKSTTSIKDIMAGAPGLSSNMTVYRSVKTSTLPKEEGIYSIGIDGYLVTSQKELQAHSGTTVLQIVLQAGVKALVIEDEAVVLDRGTRVMVLAIPDDDEWLAYVAPDSMTASASPQATMKFNTGFIPTCDECGMSPMDQFYNRCHSGQNGKFCGNQAGRRGGGGQGQQGRPGGDRNQNQRPRGGKPGFGGGLTTRTEQRLKRTASVARDIAGIVGIVAVVAGVLIASENIRNAPMNRAANAERRKKYHDRDEAVKVFDKMKNKKPHQETILEKYKTGNQRGPRTDSGPFAGGRGQSGN